MTQIGSAHPEHWYNLTTDFPEPMPPALNPVTREPLAPADLEPLFPRALIAQETSTLLNRKHYSISIMKCI